MSKYELSVAIPFYNEESNVRDVVKDLVSEFNKNKINYELILVNNGSKDSTPKIIKELKSENRRIKQVNIPKNQGYGWGVISGLNAARGDYLAYIDGDNQVHPKFLIKAYNKIKDANAAICTTIRVNRKGTIIRKIASAGYNSIVNMLFLTNVRDINSKPKIIKQKFYKELKLSSKDWFIDTEIMAKAKNNGMKVVEMAIRCKERLKGKSNVNFGIVIELLADTIKYKFNSRNEKS